MSVPTKPTESLDWAESATPPSAPGSTLPTEPSSGRKASGYGFEEPLPHSEFNWLMRTLNRWLNWVTEKMDLHVHDGGTNPESVSKINLETHINYGTNGFLKVGTDTASLHVIQHLGSAGVKRFDTGTINCTAVFTGTVTATSDALIGGSLTNSLVPKALARVKFDRTYFNNFGFFGNPTGAGGSGEYTLTLDNPAPSTASITVFTTPAETSLTQHVISVNILSTSQIQVIIRDNVGADDLDFSIAVYYP
jgi:hypothetical protein